MDKEIFEGLILSDIFANQNEVRVDEFPFGVMALCQP